MSVPNTLIIEPGNRPALLSANQWLLVASSAAGLAIGLAPWLALRGVGMGRLMKAAALASQLEGITNEQDRLVLQVRYFAILRKEHYPSRGFLAMLVIVLWASVTAVLVGLGIWLALTPAGWFWVLALIAGESLWFNATWDDRFSPQAPQMMTHAILVDKESAAWRRYLSLNGRAPRESDEFDRKLRRRERYLKWIKPAEDRLNSFGERHPILSMVAKAILAVGIVVMIVRGATGQWPWL